MFTSDPVNMLHDQISPALSFLKNLLGCKSSEAAGCFCHSVRLTRCRLAAWHRHVKNATTKQSQLFDRRHCHQPPWAPLFSPRLSLLLLSPLCLLNLAICHESLYGSWWSLQSYWFLRLKVTLKQELFLVFLALLAFTHSFKLFALLWRWCLLCKCMSH